MNDLNILNQFLIFSSAFIVKPLHMLLSLLIIIKLFKNRNKDLILARTGVSIFLLGELGCTFNYLFFEQNSLILELIHDLGMIGLGSFLSWAIFEFWETRVINILDKDKKCSFLKICNSCWKYDNVKCKLNKFLKLIIMILVGVSFLPLLSDESVITQQLCVFDTFIEYTESSTLLFIQYKVYPIIAIILFIIAFFIYSNTVLVRKYNYFLFAGLGFLFYSLMSFFLVEAFDKTLFMATVWEEITELMIILVILSFLKIFNMFTDRQIVFNEK